ncbi:MAG: hypothetical protein O3B03_05710 [Proteobacteria bacterium]|nr:hypothetical protein [Pseudomonadota bacterium]
MNKSLLIAFLLALSLAACGQKEEVEAPATMAPAEEAPAEEEPAEEAPAKD